ncbi:hypothetical protein Acr_00g0060110 [Actinidia rufa]|uniref:Uncharacterized protein n=1 Tax=Actinidia rufa TaxID=165716 RepID=A0A7J0DNA5_9ERIC|nr:hypothetical protein Acr_00g0060110 [Actinidia rufa]
MAPDPIRTTPKDHRQGSTSSQGDEPAERSIRDIPGGERRLCKGCGGAGQGLEEGQGGVPPCVGGSGVLARGGEMLAQGYWVGSPLEKGPGLPGTIMPSATPSFAFER